MQSRPKRIRDFLEHSHESEKNNKCINLINNTQNDTIRLAATRILREKHYNSNWFER